MLKLYKRILEFLINLYFRLSRMRDKRELKRWVDTHPDEIAGIEEFWRCLERPHCITRI